MAKPLQTYNIDDDYDNDDDDGGGENTYDRDEAFPKHSSFCC